MKKYEEVRSGDTFVIPKGTEFFLTTIHDTVVAAHDMRMSVEHKCLPGKEVLCGNIMKDTGFGYTDSHHGVIIGFDQLREFRDKDMDAETANEIKRLYGLINENTLLKHGIENIQFMAEGTFEPRLAVKRNNGDVLTIDTLDGILEFIKSIV